MVVQQAAMPQPTTLVMPQFNTVPPEPQVPPPPIHYGREPMYFTCPKCNKATTTMTENECSDRQWMLCHILTLTIGFGWVVFCCGDLYNVVHRCSSCHQVVGRNNVN